MARSAARSAHVQQATRGHHGAREGSAHKPGFRLWMCATETGVRAALLKLRAELSVTPLHDQTCTDAELVTAEVLNNIVEHAVWPGNDSCIVLHCAPKAGELILRFFDQGRPLPAHLLTAPAPANLKTPRQDLPEGGFGWGIVHDLAQDLRYRRSRGWNCLVLRVGPKLR